MRTFSRGISATLGALLIAASAGTANAVESVAARTAPAADLDEVFVKGVALVKLRAAFRNAEARLLTRYNELNQDEDMDVYCFDAAPTGTRLISQHCISSLEKRAQEDDAREILSYMVRAEWPMGQMAPLIMAPGEVLAARTDFRTNLVGLLRDNPDLRQLVHERAEAKRRYETEAARRFR